MATYFGYVEREADSYVNWADVGRNMSATIDNIQRVRDEKKALIEKAYNEDLDYIQSIPSGEHKTVRDWSIGFGNAAAENLRLKYNLLKQGKSSVKDFTSFRENITNDTESLYKTINNIQTVYKEKMDRLKNDENQDLEVLDMSQLERFGNLSDTKSFINGLTGAVGVGLTEEVEVDGKKVRVLKKGDDAYLTVQQLVAAVNRKYDNYDVRPDIAKWVDGFGEKIKSLRQFGSEIKAGSIIEVMDITNEELMRQAKALGYTDDQITQIQKSVDDFKKAEDLYLKGLMVDNPYHTLATLNKRLNYQPTFSKEEADKDPNKVYCERDSSGAAVPKFTPEQEKAVFDYMKGQARLMYDEKVKLNMYNEPQKPREPRVQASAAEIEAGGRARTASAMGSYIKDLWTGDMATKQVTLRTLQGEPGVDPSQTYFYTGDDGSIYLHVTKSASVDPSQPSTNIRMTQSDGVTPYGNIIDFGRNAASWIYGDAINRQILTQNLPQFESILNANPNFNPFNMKLKEDELWNVKFTPPKEPLITQFEKNEKKYITPNLFYKYPSQIAEELNRDLGKYGIKAETVGQWGVNILDKNGNKLGQVISSNLEATRKNQVDELIKIVSRKLKSQEGGRQGELNE